MIKCGYALQNCLCTCLIKNVIQIPNLESVKITICWANTIKRH